MIIKKIKINNCSELWISKDVVNGKLFVQIKIWEKVNDKFRPTNRPIVLKGQYLTELIKGLEFGLYLESAHYGVS